MTEQHSSFNHVSVRAEMTKRRTAMGKVIDDFGAWIARPVVFVALLLGHVAWIVLNLIPALTWDPPPFVLLATIASAEAPFLTLIILMRQHRDQRIAELRQEVLLHVVCRLEQQISELTSQDPLEPRALVNLVRHELERDEGHIDGENEDDDGTNSESEDGDGTNGESEDDEHEPARTKAGALI